MASLKEMRNRIGSVKSTQKITKALNMVAAAKLKRAQEQAESARPYARKMAAVIANLAAGVSGDGAPKLLAGTGRDQKHLIVVATGDKGLAGGFNTNVIRAARERIKSLLDDIDDRLTDENDKAERAAQRAQQRQQQLQKQKQKASKDAKPPRRP